MIVWALFDSGNGCYTQAAMQYSTIEIYPLQKPTRFKSNINLNLKADKSIKGKVKFENFSKKYNERSNIPLELIKDIYRETEKYLTTPKDVPSERLLF